MLRRLTLMLKANAAAQMLLLPLTLKLLQGAR
jgi:hypothetical protein